MDHAPLGASALAGLAGSKVLITGHSGFIGAWLSLSLMRAGAKVAGVSLPAPPSDPDLAGAVGLSAMLSHDFSGDIADRTFAGEVIQAVKPDVVVHLAAQPIVRLAAAEPFATYRANVLGTASVVDAIAASDTVSACLCFTTDKVYQPGNSAHKEGDPLGGNEAYGVSKACADMIASEYRPRLAERGCALSIVRAGNVIGGGDWARDRIVPDAWRAWIRGNDLELRMPQAVRPWQHVLDVVSACTFLLDSNDLSPDSLDYAWNVGPGPQRVPVADLVSSLVGCWPDPPNIIHRQSESEPVTEAPSLVLDSSRIQDAGWSPRLSTDEAILLTGAWYAQFRSNPANALDTTIEQIEQYFGPTL